MVKTFNCPIVNNIQHTIVDDEESAKILVEYVNNVIEYLDENQDRLFFYAIDIEFKDQSTQDIKAGAILMAKFFLDRLDVTSWKYDNKRSKLKEWLYCNLQPGYIVRCTDDEDVKNSLSKLFVHDQVRLVFFDIARDLAALKGSGFDFNLKHIYDCQTDYASTLDKTVFRSLAKTVYEAKELCWEADQAVKKKYVYKQGKEIEKKHPPKDSPLKDNDEYCVVDIALTAISFIYCCIEHQELANLEKYQKERIELYEQLTEKDYRGGYFQRLLTFSGTPKTNKEVLRYYDSMKMIFPNFEKDFPRDSFKTTKKDANSIRSVSQALHLQDDLENYLIDGKMYDYFMFYFYKNWKDLQHKMQTHLNKDILQTVSDYIKDGLHNAIISICKEHPTKRIEELEKLFSSI